MLSGAGVCRCALSRLSRNEGESVKSNIVFKTPHPNPSPRGRGALAVRYLLPLALRDRGLGGEGARVRTGCAAKRQKGIAMITALMIVAIAVTVTASIFVQQRYSIRLTNNFQDLEQAYQYAYAAEELAGVWLKRDAQENKHDSKHDFWASEDLPPFEIDDDDGRAIGEVKMAIEDMQGRFNINNIYNAEKKEQRESLMRAFQLLLQETGVPTGFSHSVLDWVDPDDETYQSGAETPYYLTLEPPYRAGNKFLTDSSELFAVKMDGVNTPDDKAEKLKELLFYSVALPTPTAVNVNTASSQVLIATGMLKRQADMIISYRDARPIEDMATLKTGISGLGLSDETRALLGVSSDYFRLYGQVRLGKSRLFLNSLLFRSPQGEVHVIMRQFSRVARPKSETSLFSG
ncbi:MAG: type II secretion system minor pseudopilin GspK [Thiolinea sp.]